MVKYSIKVGDIEKAIYGSSCLTQTEVAEELGTTRFVIGYRLRGHPELKETLSIRTREAKRARFSSLPKINSVVGLTCQKQYT